MPGESTTRLVPVEREHLPAFTRWFNDPEVTRHLQWYLPMTLAAEEAWYEKLAGNKDEIVFSIESTSHGIIGNCAIRIDWKNRVGNLGIVIGEKDAWGKGHGTRTMTMLVTYAFDVLGMHRAELDVHATNARAIASYRKVGFTVEGTRREAHFKDGTFINVIQMGLLDREWRARA